MLKKPKEIRFIYNEEINLTVLSQIFLELETNDV